MFFDKMENICSEQYKRPSKIVDLLIQKKVKIKKRSALIFYHADR